MCDQDHFEDDLKRYTRRDAGVLAAAVGVALALPRIANAVDVNESEVMVPTPDGECDAYYAAPITGRHAAVLIWPDIFGLRPAFRQMGKRLGEAGYSVLVVNPFYRTQRAPTAPQGAQTPIPEVRPLAQTLNPQTQVTDARAFAAWLDARPEVDTGRKMGAMGYCMSGSFVFRAAATLPDRIGAGGSFHGGGLTTDSPDSPHLLIPQIDAHFLVAIAQNDDERDPESKNTLREAFAAANVPAEIEVYPAAHGWCPPDTLVYDQEQSERAWERMMAIFATALA
jgi:carboxymethylenebutenolidase